MIRIGVPSVFLRPYGSKDYFLEMTPTAGGINFRRPVSNIVVTPDNGPDFSVTASAKAIGIDFSLILTDSNQWLFKSGLAEYEVQVILPPDGRGEQLTWYFPRMRMTRTNYEFSMTKSEVPRIDFSLEALEDMIVIDRAALERSVQESGEQFNNAILAITKILDTDMTPQELAADECWYSAGSDESCL